MQQNRPLAILQTAYIVDQLAAVWYCYWIPYMLPPIENDHDPSFDVLSLPGNFIR